MVSRETNWDALINHHSLNVVEEDILKDWIKFKGKDIDVLTLDDLESLYHQFLDEEE